jgi:hypothetical protein
MLLFYVYVCEVFIFHPIMNIFPLYSLYYSLYREWRDICVALTDFMIQRIKMESTIQKFLNFLKF